MSIKIKVPHLDFVQAAAEVQVEGCTRGHFGWLVLYAHVGNHASKSSKTNIYPNQGQGIDWSLQDPRYIGLSLFASKAAPARR